MTVSESFWVRGLLAPPKALADGFLFVRKHRPQEAIRFFEPSQPHLDRPCHVAKDGLVAEMISVAFGGWGSRVSHEFPSLASP